MKNNLLKIFVVLLIVSFFANGCSNPKNSALIKYYNQMNELDKKFTVTKNDFGDKMKALNENSKLTDIIQVMQNYADQFGQIKKDAESIDTPEKVKSLQNDFIKSVDLYISVIEDVINGLKTNTTPNESTNTKRIESENLQKSFRDQTEKIMKENGINTSSGTAK